MYHKNAVLGDTHFAHAWEYANAGARTGATGFVATDVKKLALQTDDNSLWVLTATTPTWELIGGGVLTNTAAGWTAANPTLAAGEIGYETDTTKFKIGTGALAWTALSHWRYVPEHTIIATTGGTTVLTTEQNKATSIATSGVLVGNAIIVVDDVMAPFVAENGNTGAFTTTFKTAAGTGIAISQATHQMLYADGVNVETASSAGAGSGDVVGPASAVADNVVIFDGVSGKIIKDSGKTLSGASITVTARTIGNSTNLDTALANLDDSAASHADTGWQSFGGAGNYYSIATNQLTLLRPGVGFINGKKIAWTAPQTAAVFTAYAAHWIYIDSTGTIGIANTRNKALYQNNVLLFEAYYDGTGYEVVWENHPVSLDMDVQDYLHNSVGTVLTPVAGTNVVGADMVRVATGTGTAAGDRQVKLVGTADINDSGLATNLPDSAGAALSWKFYYTNASGQWIEYSVGTEFPMFYNAAGTMTAIGTAGATDHAIWTCYAIKGEPNAGTPIYIAVADTTRYATSVASQAGIASGLNAQMAGNIYQALEPAQLGQVILFNNGSGGYIEDVMIAKATHHSSISTGGTSVAAGITTNTVNFLGSLTVTDSNVQLALETLDRIERQNASIASAATTELNGQAGYAHITGSVTITSFGTQVAGGLHHLVFDGAPLITHNATSLILPGAVDIQAAAGDIMLLRSEGNGTGTGSSGTYWRCVGFIPAAVTGTGATVKATAPLLATPSIDNADTTLSRSAAGIIAVEGVDIPTISSTHILTNKRVNPRVGSTTSSATPTITTDSFDIYQLTAQAVDITSFTTNLSGTPVEGQVLVIEITGTAARAITWGASFESSTVTLPSTTVTTAMLTVGFLWNSATSKWRCVAAV